MKLVFLGLLVTGFPETVVATSMFCMISDHLSFCAHSFRNSFAQTVCKRVVSFNVNWINAHTIANPFYPRAFRSAVDLFADQLFPIVKVPAGTKHNELKLASLETRLFRNPPCTVPFLIVCFRLQMWLVDSSCFLYPANVAWFVFLICTLSSNLIARSNCSEKIISFDNCFHYSRQRLLINLLGEFSWKLYGPISLVNNV